MSFTNKFLLILCLVIFQGILFVNARYLGGGATGTSTKNIWPGDGHVKNWLHFLIISTGFVYTF